MGCIADPMQITTTATTRQPPQQQQQQQAPNRLVRPCLASNTGSADAIHDTQQAAPVKAHMPFVALKAGLSALLFARYVDPSIGFSRLRLSHLTAICSGFFPKDCFARGVMVPAVLDPWVQHPDEDQDADEPSWEQKAREAVLTKGDHSYTFVLLKRNKSPVGDRIIHFLVRAQPVFSFSCFPRRSSDHGIITWLTTMAKDTGIRDALDKAYLRSLIVGVSLSPEDPMSIVEAYTFT